MLDDLIKKFRDAEGRSEFVIVVVCDIRNFSGFSIARQAPEIAMFIKKFYEKLLSVYFTDAAFAKPTGDGLLMTFRFKYYQTDLLCVAESVLNQCQKAINDYPTMFTNDLMINYPLPEKIGFGVARGTAFCLYAGEDAIDYSGQILNLASRLNDLAKPGGIVIDEAFLWDVIPNTLQSAFRTEEVFIRGIAEDSPRKVFCTADVTIPEAAKYPLNSYTWNKVEETITFAQLKKITGHYLITLPTEPLSMDKCKVTLSWASLLNPGHRCVVQVAKISLVNDAEGIRIRFNFAEEKKRLSTEKLKSDSVITITGQFVTKPIQATVGVSVEDEPETLLTSKKMASTKAAKT